MSAEEAPVSSVLDDLERTGGERTVSVGDMIDAFEHRSLGVLMTVFSLIAAIPIIGGIPGMSILTGTLILLAIGQSFVGGGSLWMPDAVRRRSLERQKYDKALKKSRPWLERVDRVVRPRLTALSSGRANRWVISIAAALLALTFYPLAFIPWGVTAPALGVLAFGLGLMARDGLFVLAGYAFSAATVYVLYATLISGGGGGGG